MRIALVLSDITFPPREGLHQATVLHAASLASRGHHVTVLGFVKDASAFSEIDFRAETGVGVLHALIRSAGPSLILGLNLSAFPAALQRSSVRGLIGLLNNSSFDVIHLDGVGACGLARHIKSAPFVMSLVDPGSLRHRRLAQQQRSVRKLRSIVTAHLHHAMESHLDGFSGALHVVSPADASYLRDEFGHVPTWSIPVAIPVDIEQRALSTTTTSEARDSCLRIVVYGDFRQPQMRHALGLLCKEVLYQVRDRSFKVILLGRVPADAEIEGWVSGLDFEILAWAEDYVGVLQSADIVILPDRFGTGLKNRAVQSLALGLCVLGTPVAFEGMPLLDMTHAAIASTSQEQLERLRLLLDNDRLRRQLGADGQKLTQSNYGSSNVAAAWNSAYRTLLSNDNKQIS